MAVDVLPRTYADVADMSQQFSELADNAQHKSVSFDSLRSNHESYERPLGTYLREGEQPERIEDIKKCEISGIDDNSWKISAGILDSGHLILTDQRLVAVFPQEDAPQVISVKLADIVEVKSSSGWRSEKLSLVEIEGYEYDLTLDVNEETLDEITKLTRDLHHAADSEESSAARFISRIDETIDEAEDAESALRSIADLFEQREEDTQFDQAVAEASTSQELIAQMAGAATAGGPPPTSAQAEETSMGPTDGVSSPTIRERIATTARNADPKNVGRYSIGAAVGLSTAAVSAPISTPIGIAALLAGGGAAGVYADSNPDSFVAQIDPIELAMGVKSRGSQVKSAPGPGGHGTGAVLSIAEHVGEINQDAETAKWLSQLDIDKVIEGQRTAARYSEEFDSDFQASLLGGAAGAAYGYADLDDEFDDVVDQDIVDEITDEHNND